MAFNYKQIGNSSVWVASILALGTALWYTRPAPRYIVPHPQDEAELMTGCLERKYAMCKPYPFTVDYPANVSIVISNLPYSTNLYITSSFQKTYVGYYYFYDYYYFYVKNINGGFSYVCYFSKPQRRERTGESGSCTFGGDVYGPPVANLQWFENDSINTTQYIATLTKDGTNYTWSTPVGVFANPNTLSVVSDSRCKGVLTVSYTGETLTTNVYVTNSAAYSTTNTVGAIPNGAKKYPNVIRDVLWSNTKDIGVTSYWPHSNITWLEPSNIFYTTGDWDISMILLDSNSPPTNVLCNVGSGAGEEGPDYNWWTQRVTKCEGKSISTVQSNVAGLWTQYISTNYFYSNTWWANGKQFSFERDGTTLSWSTNAYNDMGRALSCMQWQRNWGTMEKGTSVIDSDVNKFLYYYRINISGNNDTPTITESTNRQSYTPCRKADSRTYWYSGWPSYTGIRAYVELYITGWDLILTNFSPFVWTNVAIWHNSLTGKNGTMEQTLHSLTNGINWVSPRELKLFEGDFFYRHYDLGIDSYYRFWTLCTNISYLLPGESVTYRMGLTDDEFLALIPAARSIAHGLYSYSTNTVHGIHGDTPPPDMHPLPQWGFRDASANCATYRVLFNTFTNYTNYGPAR